SGLLRGGSRLAARRWPKGADALPIGDEEAYETGGPEHHDDQKQEAQNDRPAGIPDMRKIKPNQVDQPGSDDRSDQGTDTTEQRVQHDLCGQYRPQLTWTDEPLVEGVQGSRQPRDEPGQAEHEAPVVLSRVAKEGDAAFPLTDARQHETELRAD